MKYYETQPPPYRSLCHQSCSNIRSSHALVCSICGSSPSNRTGVNTKETNTYSFGSQTSTVKVHASATCEKKRDKFGSEKAFEKAAFVEMHVALYSSTLSLILYVITFSKHLLSKTNHSSSLYYTLINQFLKKEN